MAFQVGSITGDARLDTQKWTQGAAKILKSVGGIALAMKAGSALWNAFKDSVAAADSWQKSLSNVNTLLDTTVVNTQEMAKALLMLDPALGSTIELTDAMYQAFSAGAEDMEEALDITVKSATFAKAALTDTATAVDIITTAMNAYGSEVIDAEKASDLYFTTIKQGKITGEELAAVIGKSIPLFSSAGIEMEQLTAGVAAMTKVGVNAAESTTQLNAIVNSFLKPTTELTAALEAQGFASSAVFLETQGLTGALELLEDASGGQADKLLELTGNTRALRGAMALTGEGGEEFRKILEEMENASGATQTAFEKQELTFETYRNQMEKTQLVIGNIGKSFIDDIAGGATEASKSMLEFLMSAEGAELVGNTVGTLAATFHFLKTLLEPLVMSVFPMLGDILTTVGESVAELTGNTGESFEVMDLLSQGVQFSASAFTVFGKMVTGAITTVVDLVDAISASGGVVKSFWQFLKGDKEWSEVQDSVTNAKEAFIDLGTGFVDSQVDLFQTIGGEIQTFGDRVEQTTDQFNSTFTTSFQEAKDGVVENWDDLLTGQQDLTDGLNEGQQNLMDTQNETEVSRINSMAEHYRSMFEIVEDYLEETSDAEDATTKERIEALEALYAAQLVTEEEYNRASARLQEERNEERITKFQETYDLLTDVATTAVDFISDYQDSKADAELSKINEDFKKKEEMLKASNKSGFMNDVEYARRKEELEKQKLAKENAVKKKQFENNKAWTITNIWLDAAAGAMNAWANNDWVTALIITGLVAAEAIAATATASSQEFVPSRQQGGAASGLTKMNEAGAEHVILPDGSVVVPADVSRTIENGVGRGSSGTTININNPVIRDDRDIDALIDKMSREMARQMRSAS